MRFVVKPPIGSVLLLALYCSSECHNQHSCVFTMQDSLDGIEEELSRVGPTLQRYSKLTLRPSVSFAQDSPDSPLPAQAFLSQMECTEEGELRVIRGSETEWNQLGMAKLHGLTFTQSLYHDTVKNVRCYLSHLLFLGIKLID